MNRTGSDSARAVRRERARAAEGPAGPATQVRVPATGVNPGSALRGTCRTCGPDRRSSRALRSSARRPWRPLPRGLSRQDPPRDLQPDRYQGRITSCSDAKSHRAVAPSATGRGGDKHEPKYLQIGVVTLMEAFKSYDCGSAKAGRARHGAPYPGRSGPDMAVPELQAGKCGSCSAESTASRGSCA